MSRRGSRLAVHGTVLVFLVTLAVGATGATGATDARQREAAEWSSAPEASAASASPGQPAPSRTPGPSRERALAATEVFGFLPWWELDEAANLDLELLTTLAWFAVEADPAGHLIRETQDGVATPGWRGWTGAAFGDLLTRAHQAGVRVVLTVQRFAWTTEEEQATIALLQDPTARGALAADIVSAVSERGADGVNLDFEPLPREVRADFTGFTRDLRAALDAVDPGMQLTVDVTGDITSYDVAGLSRSDAADALFVMGYEYRSSSDPRAGSLAPLFEPKGHDLRTSVRKILRRVPANRVILGLPWYGRAWSTIGSEPHSRTRRSDRYPGPVTPTYETAVARAAEAGRRYEGGSESAWSLYPASACATCPVTWRQLWYDDVDSVRAKVGYALGRRLRGAGIWALGYQGDHPELWSALRLVVEGTTDVEAPVGSAEVAPESVVGQQGGLPVVGDSLRLLLVADDGPEGSGVVFVRVATSRGVERDGRLRHGVTFPAVEAVDFSVATGGPVLQVLIPPAPPSPSPSPLPSVLASPDPSSGPQPSDGSAPTPDGIAPTPRPAVGPTPSPRPTTTPEPGRRVVRVQWRDVAGNWSDPVALPVFFQSGAVPAPSPSTAPSPEVSAGHV